MSISHTPPKQSQISDSKLPQLPQGETVKRTPINSPGGQPYGNHESTLYRLTK